MRVTTGQSRHYRAWFGRWQVLMFLWATSLSSARFGRWPWSKEKESNLNVGLLTLLELMPKRRHCCCAGWLLLLSGAWMASSVLWPSGIGLQAWSRWIVPQSCVRFQRALLIPTLYLPLAAVRERESNSGSSRLNCLLSFPLTFILDQALPPLALFLLCLRLTLVQFLQPPLFWRCACVSWRRGTQRKEKMWTQKPCLETKEPRPAL